MHIILTRESAVPIYLLFKRWLTERPTHHFLRLSVTIVRDKQYGYFEKKTKTKKVTAYHPTVTEGHQNY